MQKSKRVDTYSFFVSLGMNIITTCNVLSMGKFHIIFELCINPSFVFRSQCSLHGRDFMEKSKRINA